MAVPEVLSVREFRTGLSEVLKQVNEPNADPVFVGSHRKAEAVVMSVAQFEQLQQAAVRREAVAEALASVRAEGLEPSPEGLAMFAAVANGELSFEDARAQTLARYRG